MHYYAFSESSLILELITRHDGRVSLLAKGVKRPHSQFRAVLLPLQRLLVSYSGDAEVRTLKAAEWAGGSAMPSGDRLLSGYYINELMMKLLARDDPHERIFDMYAQMVAWLQDVGNLDASLRAFEMALLRDVGLLPALDVAGLSGKPLDAHMRYSLVPEFGLREEAHDSEGGLVGHEWLALQLQLERTEPMPALRQLCAMLPAATRSVLKSQLRTLLYYHCGGRGLNTRKLWLDLQALSV